MEEKDCALQSFTSSFENVKDCTQMQEICFRQQAGTDKPGKNRIKNKMQPPGDKTQFVFVFVRGLQERQSVQNEALFAVDTIMETCCEKQSH